VGKEFSHAFGVTESEANARGAKPLWGVAKTTQIPSPPFFDLWSKNRAIEQ